jgi:hypothetical protein
MTAILRGATINKRLASLQHTLQEEQELTEREHLTERVALFRVSCQTHLGLFEALNESYRDWRGRVFRGEEPFSAEVNQNMKDGFQRWLALSDDIRGEIESFHQHGVPVDEQLTTGLQALIEKARDTVAQWRPPALSTCVALRTRRVTREEAAQLGWFPPKSDDASSR